MTYEGYCEMIPIIIIIIQYESELVIAYMFGFLTIDV